MSLSRLVFYSRINLKIGESAGMIRRLLQSCSEFSPASGLTGGLVFNEKFLMQVIEGSRDQVSRQLRTLYSDSRLEDVIILSVAEIVRREFDGWAVGYAGHTIDAERLFLRYCPTVDVNPTMMSGDALFQFVRDFCALETLYVQHVSLGDVRPSPSPTSRPAQPPVPQTPAPQAAAPASAPTSPPPTAKTEAPKPAGVPIETIRVINTKLAV